MCSNDNSTYYGIVIPQGWSELFRQNFNHQH